ncbi:MAG TPA: alpha/beta hydrolase [Giesbergeria sp.]|jgi:pimeloyl-ACP methyl ester carboxylesterase|uniref:alpha/beta fold hydrolase n=1 Tax=Simplicispira sedimenti TaxID=2919500 RepID=UPI0011DAF495|nr:alpha/beta hydrolase [Acidovorax sp. W1-6]MCL4770709.1 alpha/beta hydrolase [Burkholderiaceae bacterium]HMZ86071.1 alpha/beta hydrolase [Giesbergeria sp.]TXH59235.1 MAG: alpha/beta hydrolase [Burkholderiaceae bacterium]HNE72942.1 alpha/beta hydrolase [Giesbergeria sp.]HNI76372.1 alpha/beta hydrolase [Giesbergeria sp.]
MYQELQPARSEFVPIRQLNYHVRLWGPATSDLPPLVLVHGWMDVSASYQFVVDAFSQAFAQGRRIIAPDWRGFGLTAPPVPTDHYFFPDYLADLDQLLDHYAPGTPVDLVGHSMGGNVAMFYAGARPARVRRLVNLEGFGMPASKPTKAPKRYAEWMDELKALQRGEMALKTYDSADGVARRLMKTNPRLPQDKAQWLARHWARPNAQGQWEILGDAAHKITNAMLFRLEEALALYAAITAPTLSIEASDDSLGLWWKGRYTLEEYHQRLQSVPDCRIARVEDAGHMLHHDQPQAVAALIEGFLQSK